jgi:hypothetical protein
LNVEPLVGTGKFEGEARLGIVIGRLGFSPLGLPPNLSTIFSQAMQAVLNAGKAFRQ